MTTQEVIKRLGVNYATAAKWAQKNNLAQNLRKASAGWRGKVRAYVWTEEDVANFEYAALFSQMSEARFWKRWEKTSMGARQRFRDAMVENYLMGKEE